MKQLATEIHIDASPEQVWAVLVAFGSYSTWNPFIVEAEGEAVAGADLRLRLSPPGGRAMTLTPQVTELLPGSILEWRGRLAVPFMFAGRHRFELQRTASGTHVAHRETFTGVLVPFLSRSLDTHTRSGFIAMNDALKARVESVTATLA